MMFIAVTYGAASLSLWNGIGSLVQSASLPSLTTSFTGPVLTFLKPRGGWRRR